MKKDVLNLEEAVEMLKTSKPTFYRWIKEGRLNGFKVGREWRFYRTDLLTFLESTDSEKEALNKRLKEAAGFYIKKLIKKGVNPEDWSDSMVTSTQILKKTKDETESLSLKLAESIISDAITDGASDIHIEQHRDYSVIRYRIAGLIKEVSRHSGDEVSTLARGLKKMGSMNPDIEDSPQEGRILLSKNKDGEVVSYDLILSTLPTFFGEKITIRILDGESISKVLQGRLETVGFEGQQLEELTKMLNKPNGLIVFSGFAGSGKTTTIYAALNYLKHYLKGEANIMTLEEPIACFMDGIIQTNVRSDSDFNFPGAMRAMMKMDPDVVYIGRDVGYSILEKSMECALGGHLVITQTVAYDTVSVIKQFLELAVEPYALSLSLGGIVNQRLARKLCDNCKQETEISWTVIEKYKDIIPELQEHKKFYRGTGCDHCRQAGFRGRVGIYEILPHSELMKEFIYTNPSEEEMRERLKKAGFKTYLDNAVKLALEGKISLEEVLRIYETRY
jgi:excisionase family DNA binding protein